MFTDVYFLVSKDEVDRYGKPVWEWPKVKDYMASQYNLLFLSISSARVDALP